MKKIKSYTQFISENKEEKITDPNQHKITNKLDKEKIKKINFVYKTTNTEKDEIKKDEQ